MVTGKELVGPARVFSSDLRIPEDIRDTKVSYQIITSEI